MNSEILLPIWMEFDMCWCDMVYVGEGRCECQYDYKSLRGSGWET